MKRSEALNLIREKLLYVPIDQATFEEQILSTIETMGYTIDNCVPCCFICNRAKHQMSIEDFNLWLDNLVAFRTG